MKRSLLCAFLLGAFMPGRSVLVAGDNPADSPSAQIQRGRDQFLNSSKGLACSTCHLLEGSGNAVGPDLTRLASVVGPRGLVMTINMSMTAYVQEVELRNGRRFPGIQKEKNGDTLTIYDLSKTPAALLKVNSNEVASMKPNTKWTHPPASAGYTQQELADIIAYLKYASTGIVKDVSVSELH